MPVTVTDEQRVSIDALLKHHRADDWFLVVKETSTDSNSRVVQLTRRSRAVARYFVTGNGRTTRMD